jgi:hypothetical protein
VNDTSRRLRGAVVNEPTAGSERALWPVEILERHAVEDLLAGREVVDEDLAREVVVGAEDRPAQRPRVVEARRRGDLDQHPAGAVGARPHDPGVGGDVAALDAVGELGSRAQERGRASREGGERDAGGGAGTQELPAVQ